MKPNIKRENLRFTRCIICDI